MQNTNLINKKSGGKRKMNIRAASPMLQLNLNWFCEVLDIRTRLNAVSFRDHLNLVNIVKFV